MLLFRCSCNPSLMEAHHLKGGDFIRMAPHTLSAVLPKMEDKVINEAYNHTGLVTPEQLHPEFIRQILEHPTRKWFISVCSSNKILYSD